MNLSRISFIAAVLGAVFWIAKAVSIGIAGSDEASSLASPLFLVGFLFHVVGVVTLALWWTRHRALAVRALAGVGIIVAAFLVTVVIEQVLALVKPADPGWVWGELNLWIVATALLVLTWREVRGAASARGADQRETVTSDFR